MQNIFKIDAIRAIRSVRVTTERLARVMKRDALSRKRDYQQIKELNYRLARVIPIIPGRLGAAGAIFGVGAVASSSGGFLLPPFGGFPPFPGPPGPPRPPGPQPPGPGAPVPQPQPVPDIDIIKEEVEEPTVVDVEDPLDERSPEYNRRKQEEAKRKREQERIREGVPAGVPATPEEKPGEMEEEAQPERNKPEVVPTTPPFVPTPPQVPAEPKFDPQRTIELLETLTGVPAPPFLIPDVATQRGVPATAPPVSIPNFDPDDQKQRDDLKKKINDYIKKVPNSPFENKLQRGGVLPDGTLIIKQKGKDVVFSEPLTLEQQRLIRLMGIANLAEWLPVVPIRGTGPRRGTLPGTSRPNRPLKPNIERYRQQLEQSFQQPSAPGAQPTQPALPGACINQPRIPAGTRSKGVVRPLETTGPTVDVTPTAKRTTRRTGEGIAEFLGSGSSRRIQKTFVGQQREALGRYSNEQLSRMLDIRSTPVSVKKMIREILNSRIEANILKDPSAVQGPLGPQASAKTLIQPIIIYRDSVA